VLTGLRLR